MKSIMVKVVLPIILIFLFTYASAQPKQTESRDAEFCFNRGLGSYCKGQYDQAISDFTKALEINPRDTMVYNNRGVAYKNKGLYGQAISDLTKSLEINPRYADAYYNRGLVYSDKGQHDQAISDYTKALEINPRYAEVYNDRGIAYEKKGQSDQAISDFTKALEINPRYAYAYYNRGFAYSDEGQYDQAISDFNKVIEIDPRDADAYINRQIAYKKKGQNDRAISDYNEAHRGEYPKAKSNMHIRITHYIVAVAVLISFLLLKKLLTSKEQREYLQEYFPVKEGYASRFSERNRLPKCKTCGSPLVDGPYVERHGGNDRFKCTVKDIPTKVCPHGCPGAYWYQPNFSDEVGDAIGEDSESVAQGNFCRRCNTELTDKGQRAQFVFRQKLKKGTGLELAIEAPCLECTHCGSKYLPSLQTSDGYSYYAEMDDVIAEVISQEPIFE